MSKFDRHIGISAGWVAGPATGVMLMGAALYFHLGLVFGCMAFWGGLAVLLCSLLAVMAHGLKERRPDKTVLGPAILTGLCLVGLCVAAAWYFWPNQKINKVLSTSSIPKNESPSPRQQDTPPGLVPSQLKSARKNVVLAIDPSGWAPSTLDQTVLLECQRAKVPDVIPEGGWYELGATMGMGIIRSTNSVSLGSPNGVTTADFPLDTYRCRFTNFGPEPVLNVEADLTFQFLSIIPQENGIRSGDVIKTLNVQTPRVNLGVGEKATFDFYIRNYTYKAWLNVLLPKTVRLQAVGSSEWRVSSLIPPQIGGFGLPPFSQKQIE